MTYMPAQLTLFNGAVPAAVTGATTTPITGLCRCQNLDIQCNLTYGSGGTTIDVYVQTSFDAGATWVDIAEFSMTTSNYRKGYCLTTNTAVSSVTAFTDGTLSANTSLSGFIGDQLRLKYTIAGTYAGSTLRVDACAKAAS